MLLAPDGSLSPHAEGAAAVAGELALVPPLLGASQRLLNRDHYDLYYEVSRVSVSRADPCIR